MLITHIEEKTLSVFSESNKSREAWLYKYIGNLIEYPTDRIHLVADLANRIKGPLNSLLLFNYIFFVRKLLIKLY